MTGIVPITIHGIEKLREELKRLKRKERPRIVAAISEARAHGDLKENAEYHAAREQQGFVEGRIQEIEAKLGNCHVIDISQIPNEGKVIFGSTVTLLNLDTEAKITYKIVGEDEADLKEHKISIHSPIARAIIGKFVEDVIDIDTPKGTITYEIVNVDHV